MNKLDEVQNFEATVSSGLQIGVSRRSVMKGLAGLGVGAALAGPALGLISPVAARSTDSLIVNTAGARLRSGPGTGYSILASLSKGTEVRYLADGGSANGYRWSKVQVLATGKQGFVAASLLSAPDGSGDPVIIGTAKTTANVNLRSGPSTSNTVLKVVPTGSTVQISGQVQNGFRYVIISGLAGWISDQFLSSGVPGDGPYDPNYATTTGRLNLRAQPSPSAPVLLVMPSGATVQLLEGGSGQFRKVSYKGTVGWAAYAYLN